MARPQWIDNPANRTLVDDIKRHLAHGMGYTRAVARVIRERQRPGEPPVVIHSSTIRRAQEIARIERAAEGRRHADATRQARRARERIEERRRQGERIPQEPGQPIVYGDPSGRTGEVEYRRVDVRVTDPRTGAAINSPVYLPLLGTLNQTNITGQVFAALMQHLGREVVSEEGGLYDALIDAGRTGVILI